jgi:four helix bundle protein
MIKKMSNELISKPNIIVSKSYAFALDIIALYKILSEEKKEFVMSKQLLRSGTSIGANINEAQSAESKNDFIHKMGISAKECRETIYWINLLKDSNYISEETFIKYSNNAKEILKVLNSIILSSKQKV